MSSDAGTCEGPSRPSPVSCWVAKAQFAGQVANPPAGEVCGLLLALGCARPVIPRASRALRARLRPRQPGSPLRRRSRQAGKSRAVFGSWRDPLPKKRYSRPPKRPLEDLRRRPDRATFLERCAWEARNTWIPKGLAPLFASRTRLAKLAQGTLRGKPRSRARLGTHALA